MTLISSSPRAYSGMIESIISSIRNGELTIGSRLPSEAYLRDTFSISVTSVRRGIDELICQGIVERRHGSGTYVTGNPFPQQSAEQVSRNTIYIYSDFQIQSYHPFYSEVWKGVRRRLGSLCWEIYEEKLSEEYRHAADTNYHLVSTEDLFKFFEKRRDIAGAIFSAAVAEKVKSADRNPGFPYITLGLCDGHVCAGYDWQQEFESAIHEIVRLGAKKILCVTNNNLDRLKRIYSDDNIQLENISVQQDIVYSRVTSQIYNEVKKYIENNPDTDGFVASSDFEAQGMFDAMSESRHRLPQYHAAALINKTSRLYTSIPFIALEADGFLLGQAMADLINDQLLSPESSAKTIKLQSTIRQV